MKLSRRETKALRAVFPSLQTIAEHEAPRETCGLVEWDGRHMTLRPCENVSYEPETSFVVSARDQDRHMTEIEALGTEFWAVYHSHPHEGAGPSELDRRFAADVPHVRWLIAGLAPEDGTAVEFWVGYP